VQQQNMHASEPFSAVHVKPLVLELTRHLDSELLLTA
jgi:hypothetical protein